MKCRPFVLDRVVCDADTVNYWRQPENQSAKWLTAAVECSKGGEVAVGQQRMMLLWEW